MAGVNPLPLFDFPPFFHIFAIVKRLMLKYLDTKYPNAFIKRTKFGLCPYYDGEILNGHLIKLELKYWFGINDIESGEKAVLVVMEMLLRLFLIQYSKITDCLILLSETIVHLEFRWADHWIFIVLLFFL